MMPPVSADVSQPLLVRLILLAGCSGQAIVGAVMHNLQHNLQQWHELRHLPPGKLWVEHKQDCRNSTHPSADKVTRQPDQEQEKPSVLRKRIPSSKYIEESATSSQGITEFY